MLTLMGLRKLKGMLIKLAVPGDSEVNAIVQEAVKSVNRLMKARFPKN